MQIHFSKIQSSGSDHVVIGPEFDAVDWAKSELDPIVRLLCSRSGPVGADGLVLIGSRSGSCTPLRIFTPDAREPALCVNGILCAARFLDDVDGLTPSLDQRGIRKTLFRARDERFPSGGFSIRTIAVTPGSGSGDQRDQAAWLASRLPLEPGTRVTLHSTGTPHAVAFVRQIDERSLQGLGDLANADRQTFPDGINISLCRTVSSDKIFVRTFERGGAGLSMSCASASVATVHAAIDEKLVDAAGSGVQVITLGGLALVGQIASTTGAGSYSYAADVSRDFDASTLYADGALGPVVQETAYASETVACGKYREEQLESIDATRFLRRSAHV